MTSFGFSSTGNEVVSTFKDSIAGKTILITGTSDKGLGAETAVSLATANPAHLLLLARSASKVDPVIAKIKELNSNIKTTFVSIELDDFDSVRKAADLVNSSVNKLDIIINNAGIMMVKKFTTNKNGIESQFATNHLGHFLFTKLVFDKVLAAGKGARIVNLTSDGYTISPMRLNDYNFNDGKDYDGWSGYGQSKTANVLFTRELAIKAADRGILSYAVHPGVIVTTSLGTHVDQEEFAQINDVSIKNTGRPFVMGEFKNSQQGVATTLVAALDPRLADQSGSYLVDCAVHPLLDYAASAENAHKLWTLSEQLVGEKFVI